MTDPLGHVTRTDVDFTNKKNTTIEAYGTALARTTESNFNIGGPTTSTKDGLGKLTSFTYNSVNEMVTQTDPLNHTVTYTKDKNGNTTKFTDALMVRQFLKRQYFTRFSNETAGNLGQQARDLNSG